MYLLLFIMMITLSLMIIHSDMLPGFMESKKWIAIAALSQLIIATVAVLREWMEYRLFPFKVDIILYRPEGVITVITGPMMISNEVYSVRLPTIYFYLQVMNIQLWRRPIEQCEIHLAEIWRRTIEGDFSRVESFAVPIPLTWAPAIPGRRDITLKTKNLVDFLRVNINEQCLEPVFADDAMPNNFEGRIRPGDVVRYYVELSGKGYTSEKKWGFEITFDGVWIEQMEELRNRIRLINV